MRTLLRAACRGGSNLRRCSSAATAATPPPPAGVTPPPPGQAASTPPTPDTGLQCGGFFFAVDPNIGLWNDKVNPNWRLTFTDPTGQKPKERVPYAMAIQNKGPHVELGLRLQFGYVHCENLLPKVPESLSVESGWEVSLPLPFMSIRYNHTVLRAGDQPATVYCVDCPIGFSAGVQTAIAGVGVKGASELSWKGDIAMAAFVCAALFSVYSVVSLPWTWSGFIDDLNNADDDLATAMAFEALDVDGDGFITRQDVRAFVGSGTAGLAGLQGLTTEADADALFSLLDAFAGGTGQVGYEQFEAFLENVRDGSFAPDGRLNMPFSAGGEPARPVELQPFGGAFGGSQQGPVLGSGPWGLPSGMARGPSHPGPKGPWE